MQCKGQSTSFEIMTPAPWAVVVAEWSGDGAAAVEADGGSAATDRPIDQRSAVHKVTEALDIWDTKAGF